MPGQIVARRARWRRRRRRWRSAARSRRAGAAGCAGRFRLRQPAAGRHIEIDPAAGADDEHAAGRHRDRRARGLHRLAGPQALQDQRRPAGIGRRADPGVDTEIRRRDRALPVEGGGDALHAVAAGDEEGRDQQHQHERAQRHRIARRRPAAPAARPAASARSAARARCERARARAHACLRSSPPILSEIVVAGRCDRPELRSSRRSFSVRLGSRTQQQRQQRGRRDQAEHAKPDGAAERRQPQPQAKPGQREEQSNGGRDRRQRRPQPLPQNAPARSLSARSSMRLAAFGGARLDLGAGAGTSVKSISSKENLASFDLITH